jgi:hypothetical protein
MKTIGAIILFSLLALCLVDVGSASVTILSGANNGTEFVSAQFYKKGDNFDAVFEPITGILVDETSSDMNGRIVYMTEGPKSQFWPRVLSFIDRGVIGVIHGADYIIPGQDFCTWNGEDMTLVTIPVAEINAEEFAAIHTDLIAGGQVLIQLTSEGNPWTEAIISIAVLVVFRVFLGGFALSLAIYALYKLILFVRKQGSHFNVPQVCLALEILSNLWRVVYLVVDPMGCNFVYPASVNSFLDSVSLPYATATFVLVTFYWHEVVTDASIVIYPFLSRLKIPFFVIMFLLIAMDITLSLLGFYLDFSTTTPMTVIYLLITVAFLIFYIVTLVRVMKRMRMSKEVRGDTGKFRRLSQINTKMILNAVVRFCVIIVAIAFVFPQVNRYPVPQVITTAFLFFIVTLDSLMRLLLFDIASTQTSSKKSTDETKLSDVNTRDSATSVL